MAGAGRRVAYFYDSEIGNYHYGQGHPMKVRRNGDALGRDAAFPPLQPLAPPPSHHPALARTCSRNVYAWPTA